MKNFSAQETEWMLELDGIELADFKRRAAAFLLDWIFITIIISILGTLGVSAYVTARHLQGKPSQIEQMLHSKGEGHDYNFSLGPGEEPNGFGHQEKCEEKGEHHGIRDEALHLVTKLIVPVLYFGVLLWKGKGRTPGKRLMKIRVVSIVHRHLTFWHCFERALGYGAAALELGFGFIQYFIHPYRRCAQDRLAETIVVTEAGYQGMQHKLSHPLIPDEPAAS